MIVDASLAVAPDPASHAAPDPGADTAFFRELFDQHHAYVHRSLLRLGVPARDCEDLTHDVFVVVYRKLAAYDRARPLKPWLLAIAARTASDYRHRSRHHREQLGPAPETEGAEPAADARLEALDARELLLRALQSVAEERRALIVMVDLDETSVADAARALELPLNTAYSRLRLARAELTAAVLRLRAAGGAP